MLTAPACRVLAAYNAEMNRRLYAAADTLDDAARRAERGAFFGSIHGTLCHLLWGDRMWMHRFAGWERPEGSIAESVALIPEWAALGAARSDADAAIEAWAATINRVWLAGEQVWFSGAVGREMRRPTWVTVLHMFNHQTHHRGQVHCLLTQAGVRPAATDLPWVVEEAVLRAG